MNWHTYRPHRRVQMILGLMIAAALGLGVTASVRGQALTAPITASFAPSSGVLTVRGDDTDNTIVVGRDAAGTILVNGGAVPISGGTPTVTTTVLIRIFGRGGNDQLTLDQLNGALPPAYLDGGAGDDTLTGGAGADQLIGGAGNDTLLGSYGDDLLDGGSGNDTLVGGPGSDRLLGGSGDDRIVWNPGDGSDLIEGGDGRDTVEVNGGAVSEVFTITANGTRVRLDRNIALVTLDIGTAERLVINARGGDDTVTAGAGLAGLIQIIVDGGPGNDTLTGGDGDDILIGGDGDDTITGGAGHDILVGGPGIDVLNGDPEDILITQD